MRTGRAEPGERTELMACIGLLSIAHPDYVADGAAARFAEKAAAALRERGIDVIRTELAATIPEARAAARELIARDVDGVIYFMASWLECSVALAAVTETAHLPGCLWSFPMWRENGRECSTGSYVSGAMLGGVLRRMGLEPKTVFGMPGEDGTAEEVAAFCRAAGAWHHLRRCRIGLVGYTSMNILTGTFDHLLLRSRLGPDVEQSDAYTLISMARTAAEEELLAAEAKLRSEARVSPDIPDAVLKKALGIYVALMKLKERQSLDAVNVKCQYEFSKEYGMTACVPLSMVAGEDYIASCEGDMFCTVSQLILRYLTGQVIAYGDAISDDGTILKTSPCGFMPFCLGRGTLDVVSFPEGFGFSGLICSFPMKPGRVTLLRVVEDVGDYHLLYLTGEGLASTEKRQGIFPALDVRPDGDLTALRREYAGQHFALCYGDVSAELEDLARIWKIRTVRI